MTRLTATAFLAFLLPAFGASAADLTITVDGVASADGQATTARASTYRPAAPPPASTCADRRVR